MKINTNSKDFELELYLKIVDIIQDDTISPENKEIWKNKSIIELMNLLKYTQNRSLIANALVILLSLFEDLPPDLYTNRGHNINCISEKDKKFLISKLRNEFLPN